MALVLPVCELLGGVEVPEVSRMKLLGVTFDPKLTFGPHIREVAVRTRRRLGLLCRAAPLLSQAGRMNVYRSFSRPMMEYALLTWMSARPCPSQPA